MSSGSLALSVSSAQAGTAPTSGSNQFGLMDGAKHIF